MIQYRPTPTAEWRTFIESDNVDLGSLERANAASGYVKYRLVETVPVTTFSEVE